MPELNYAAEFTAVWKSDLDVSTAIGQFEAVCAGAGIGTFHDFMGGAAPDLVRLFPDLSVTRSYWLVWHENLRAARRVQATAELFDKIVREECAFFRISHQRPDAREACR